VTTTTTDAQSARALFEAEYGMTGEAFATSVSEHRAHFDRWCATREERDGDQMPLGELLAMLTACACQVRAVTQFLAASGMSPIELAEVQRDAERWALALIPETQIAEATDKLHEKLRERAS
jgi:cytochrome b